MSTFFSFFGRGLKVNQQNDYSLDNYKIFLIKSVQLRSLITVTAENNRRNFLSRRSICQSAVETNLEFLNVVSGQKTPYCCRINRICTDYILRDILCDFV